MMMIVIRIIIGMKMLLKIVMMNIVMIMMMMATMEMTMTKMTAVKKDDSDDSG